MKSNNLKRCNFYDTCFTDALMLKSDQQEKVPTTIPARSTAETHFRRIPNNVNKEQEIHLRNLMDLNKPWSISDTTKLREKPNHKTTTELHLRN